MTKRLLSKHINLVQRGKEYFPDVSCHQSIKTLEKSDHQKTSKIICVTTTRKINYALTEQ